MIEVIVGLLFCVFLYLLGRVVYPEPNKMLINYAESVNMMYGREEE